MVGNGSTGGETLSVSTPEAFQVQEPPPRLVRRAKS